MGKFCISIDFEKKWGLIDKKNPDYDNSIYNVDFVVDGILHIFDKYKIRASWGVVGALVFENYESLLEYSNYIDKIDYHNDKLSPSKYFAKNDVSRELFFARESVKKIVASEGQNIVSHTLYHTYYRESGITNRNYIDEKQLFDNLFLSQFGLDICGIIFPRNQIPTYNGFDLGYKFYRSNHDNYLDRCYSESELSLLVKILRTLDCYLPLRFCRSSKPYKDEKGFLAIPATRFFRPTSKNLLFNKLKINRIKMEMTWAAKNNDVYHLWWHPHNFAQSIRESLNELDEILVHFNNLQTRYGMESVNMNDLFENNN